MKEATITKLASVVDEMIIWFGWNTLKNSSAIFGALTIVLSLNLLLGLWDKLYNIIQAKSPGQQSLLEMFCYLIKELSGTGYGLSVGFEKMWPLVVAMCSIALVRILNVVLYLHYSRKKIWLGSYYSLEKILFACRL